MIYNVKLSVYSGELQISYYEDGITYTTEKEKELNENNKQIFDNDKSNLEYSTKTLEVNEWVSEITPSLNNPFNDDLVTYIQGDIKAHNPDDIRRSLSRTKQIIYEYTRANVWEFFSTFTFDGEYRYDYGECKRKFSQFLNNLKKRYVPDLKYIAVPEQHKDGAWHFHALITGNIKPYLADGFNKGRFILTKYNLGINELEPVRDTHKVSMYITKYITKDMLAGMKNAQRFLVSKGLNKAETKKIYLPADTNIIDFIESNFPEYEITYSKHYETESCYGHDANYIQLALVSD